MAAQKRMGYTAEAQQYKCAQTAGSFLTLQQLLPFEKPTLIRTNNTYTLYHVGRMKSKQDWCNNFSLSLFLPFVASELLGMKKQAAD